ncbi:MAG: hypothetical protein ACJZ1R_03370 [Candidatus Neomarinimicrobiota bacterium]
MEKIINLSSIPILTISCFESGKVTRKDPSIICAALNDWVSHVLFDKKNI